MAFSEDDTELKVNLERIYERWEHKIKAQGVREGVRKGISQGKAEGKAELLLTVLEGRGLDATAAQRAQILAAPCGTVARTRYP